MAKTTCPFCEQGFAFEHEQPATGEPVYQICKKDSQSISSAWIDVEKQAYEDAGIYPEYGRRTLYTHPAPSVPDERGAFESCTLMEGSLFKRRADDPDKYWDGNVQDDWELWQARAILSLRR
jgi:hypothetical protein